MPEELVPYGWDDRVATLYTLVEVPGHRPGRVIRADRGSCLAALPEGIARAHPHTLAARRHGIGEEPVTGDWVAVVDDPAEGAAVVAILPRRSAITRRDPDSKVVKAQVLAANVDVVAAVCALDRPYAQNRVERFLVVAWESGATPVLVLTKSDLAADTPAIVAEATKIASGVTVLATSAVTGEGIEHLRALLAPARTLALLGLSGAGKSTLVNRLVGTDVRPTAAVRDSDRRGRHTTSARELVPVPGGGVLLDTPGLRSLGLWGADAGIAAAFPELEELASACRFGDCRHAGEPACAVRAAIDEGALDPRRLASYRKLERELAWLALEQDERARRSRRRQVRQRGREIRRAQRDGRRRTR